MANQTKKGVKPVSTNVPGALFTKMSRWIVKGSKTSYYQNVYYSTSIMVQVVKGVAKYKVEQTAKNKVTELYSGNDRAKAYEVFNKVPFSKCTYYNNRNEYTKNGKTVKGKGWVTTTRARNNAK